MFFKINKNDGAVHFSPGRRITKEEIEKIAEDWDKTWEHMKKMGIISKNHKKENGDKTP